MSGIAGILNLDGSPVDGRLLARMTEYLRFRGPDGHGMHAIGNVGFCHTLLELVEDEEPSNVKVSTFPICVKNGTIVMRT